MREIIFSGVVASLFIYDLLLIVSIAKPDLRFWPLPENPSWRREVMRIAGALGPLSIVGILVLGVLDGHSFGWQHWTRLVVGGLLFVFGGVFALWGFFGLGARASQGLGGPLLASGAYRYSRNPQYVGTVAGIIGYSLICDSSLALVASILWSSWYLMAPFAEEPWLRKALGAAYDEYASKVRRFI